MKENSPICVRPTPTRRAVDSGCRKIRVTVVQIAQLPITMSPTSTPSRSRFVTTTRGSMRTPSVAKGQEAREHLVSVVRLVDEEPRQERAQRERETGRLRQRGRAEADGERHEQKELVAPCPRDAGQDRGQDAAGGREERDQEDPPRPGRACGRE